MRTIKLTILVFMLVLMSACAAPRYAGKAISFEDIGSVPEIVIIEDEATKKGFLDTIKEWLIKNNYKYIVKSNDSSHELDKVTIEYVGYWKWDLAIYLSAAKIEAFHNGQRVGEVNYNAPNSLNMNKFGNGAERIEYMLEILFGKISELEATQAIKSK
ncbi:MAG: Sbal_3080 family lipoprotein [Gammaproteobacteria bacterium]|nr:Sbal_3080 family lipoprotein [Gammaproteobacteria bacterium]